MHTYIYLAARGRWHWDDQYCLTYIYIYVYAYINTYIHTYVYTYIHTYSLNPFTRCGACDSRECGSRISAKCAGSAALPSSVLFSLSHMNTIWSNTAGCAVRAHTLIDVRFSPRVCGARTFHEGYNQPYMQLWS